MSNQTSSPQVKRKDKFTGTVIKTTLAGAVVNIGLDKPAVIHISKMSAEPVKRVEDILQVGQEIDVWVNKVNKNTNLVELTMLEPIALDWGDIKKGMAVKGTVTRLEKFGAFIEIGAERPGLAHISELTHEYVRTPEDAVKVGEEVEARVLDFSRKKKQIKLSLKALKEEPVSNASNYEEEEDEVVTPALTAMEIAYRRAMDGQDDDESGSSQVNDSSSYDKKSQKEQEAIIARTLQQRPE
ncbi:MAG: S1 RNA-binding domain-containing protein [Anaerolineae bacterium]|nr:S1 RNA-binding domain-containing protein [Anaerolineae bacterium]